MITAWMAYAIVVGSLLGVGGLALERFLRTQGFPSRWIWAGVIFLSIGWPVGHWALENRPQRLPSMVAADFPVAAVQPPPSANRATNTMSGPCAAGSPRRSRSASPDNLPPHHTHRGGGPPGVGPQDSGWTHFDRVGPLDRSPSPLHHHPCTPDPSAQRPVAKGNSRRPGGPDLR